MSKYGVRYIVRVCGGGFFARKSGVFLNDELKKVLGVGYRWWKFVNFFQRWSIAWVDGVSKGK